MFRANQHSVLRRLIHHAATMNYLLNTQDAILIIKSLQALQVRTNEVKHICEKASISIAANPTETNATVVIDVVNALASLQASNIKVVHSVLVKRFLELGGPENKNHKVTTTAVGQEREAEMSRSSPNPKTVQKAAIALLKLGKRHVRADVADHVFQLLVCSLRETPDDVSLHLALISTFCLLSKKWYELNDEFQSALFDACAFLFGDSSSGSACLADTLRGNMAWQAMHFYVLYAQVALYDPTHVAKPDELDGFFVEDNEYTIAHDEVVQKQMVWLASFYSFLSRAPIHVESMSAGSYAQFLSDHLKVLWLHSPTRRATLAPLQDSRFFARFNTYDVAKVATTLCNALERHPASPSFEVQGEAAAATMGADLQVLHVAFNCTVRLEKMLRQDVELTERKESHTGSIFLVQRHGTTLGATWQLFQVAALVAFTAEKGEEEEEEWHQKKDKILRRLCQVTMLFLSCTPPDGALISWLFNSMAKVARTGAYGAELDALIHNLFEKQIQPLGTLAGAAGGHQRHLVAEHVKNLLSYTFLCTLSPLELHSLRGIDNSVTPPALTRTAKYSVENPMASTLLDHVHQSLTQRRLDGEKNTKMLADALGIYLKELAGPSAPRKGAAAFRSKLIQLTLSFLEIAADTTSNLSTAALLSLIQCGVSCMSVPDAVLPYPNARANVPAQLLEWVAVLQTHDVNFLQWSMLLFRVDAMDASSPTFQGVCRQTIELHRCILDGVCETSAAANYTDGQRPDYIAPQQWLHAAEVVRRRGAVLYMDVETYFLASKEKRTERGTSKELFFVDVDAFLKHDIVADDVVSAHLLRLIGEDYKMKGTLPTKRVQIDSLLRWCLYGTKEEQEEGSQHVCSVQCLVYLLNASTFLLRNDFLSITRQQRILKCVHAHLVPELPGGDGQVRSTTGRKSAMDLLSALCEAEVFWQTAKQKCNHEAVRSVKEAAVAVGFSMAESSQLEEQMCALKVNLL